MVEMVQRIGLRCELITKNFMVACRPKDAYLNLLFQWLRFEYCLSWYLCRRNLQMPYDLRPSRFWMHLWMFESWSHLFGEWVSRYQYPLFISDKTFIIYVISVSIIFQDFLRLPLQHRLSQWLQRLWQLRLRMLGKFIVNSFRNRFNSCISGCHRKYQLESMSGC